MDTHVTAHLPVEEDNPAPSARVAGETDAPILEGGFREGNPEPGVRLPGEAEEPPLGEGFAEFSRISAPSMAECLPTVPRPWWGRRRILLLGAAVITLCAAGAATLLVFPNNHAYPIPHVASTLRHWAAQMGIARTEPLAPAASLAGVPTEPAEPVTREKYQPKRKDEQLQEVLALRGGAPDGSRGDGQSAKVPPAAVAPAPGQNAGASDRDAPPPGYVPREPGANPASIPATPGARRVVGAADAASPLPAVAAPALPAGEPPHDATAGVLAALGPASKPAGSSLPSPAPPAQADVPPPPALPVEPRDPVETAGALRPAALTPADQVQVLELVTQMAAIVRDLRAQQTQPARRLRQDCSRQCGPSCGFRAPVGACRSPSRALGGADCRRAARFVAPGLSLGASKRSARGPRFKCGADGLDDSGNGARLGDPGGGRPARIRQGPSQALPGPGSLPRPCIARRNRPRRR